MYKGIGGSSGYGIGKIVIIKNDMPVYETKSPENKENEIKRFLPVSYTHLTLPTILRV